MGKTSLGATGRRLAFFAASAVCFYACGDSDDDGLTDDGGDAGEAGEVSAGRSGGGGKAGGGGGARSGAGAAGTLGGTPIEPGSAGEGGAAAGGTATGGTTGGTTAGGPSGGTTPGAAGEGGAGGDSGGAPEGGASPGGAGGTGGESGEGGSGGAPFVEFCAGLGPIPAGVSKRSCFDFSVPGDATGWVVEEGGWAITDGAYVGTAGANDVPACDPGSAMLTSVAPAISATNVRVHARMWNIQGSDKVIVLRGVDTGDRVELNFRSNFLNDEAGVEGGDLVIQSLVNCVATPHVPIGQILIPHEQTDVLDVEIQLVAQTLSVRVNGTVVYSNAAPLVGPALQGTFATAPGAVGFGVLRYGGLVGFDDLLVEVLD